MSDCPKRRDPAEWLGRAVRLLGHRAGLDRGSWSRMARRWRMAADRDATECRVLRRAWAYDMPTSVRVSLDGSTVGFEYGPDVETRRKRYDAVANRFRRRAVLSLMAMALSDESTRAISENGRCLFEHDAAGQALLHHYWLWFQTRWPDRCPWMPAPRSERERLADEVAEALSLMPLSREQVAAMLDWPSVESGS